MRGKFSEILSFSISELLSYASGTLMRGKSRTCRQTFLHFKAVYDREEMGVGDPMKESGGQCRQVGDLPRIGVAEPSLK
jgi:hypothetical protein